MSSNTAASNKPNSRKKKKPGIFKIILLILLLLFVLVLVSGGVFIWHYLNKIEKIDKSSIEVIDPKDVIEETDFTDPVEPTDDPVEPTDDPAVPSGSAEETQESTEETPGTRPAEPESSAAPKPTNPVQPTTPPTPPKPSFDPNNPNWPSVQSIDDGKLVQIMLIGQDDNDDGSNSGNRRSDTMILASINTSTGSVSLISFLRDLYVQIPGYRDTRLNSAFWYGGLPLMYKTYETNFGLHLDHAIVLDFRSFTKVFNLIGTVKIALSAEEAAAIGVGEEADTYELNAKKALSYARLRSIDNDFGRTNRQRKLLMAALTKVRSMSIGEINNLLNQVLPLISTDMSNLEILGLAAQLIPRLNSLNISSYAVPSYGNYTSMAIRNMAVLVPDLTAINYQLRTQYLPINR